MDSLSQIWMQRCEELADAARARGEAAVGAIIVRDGTLLAEACEQVRADLDVAGHAELIAIRAACQTLQTMDLAGCTLYTNIEPCWMCAFAIRETGIARVVIGAPVPEIGGATSRYPILTAADVSGWPPPPEVVWCPLEDEREKDDKHDAPRV